MERIQVALIDDQQLFRQGIALLLNNTPAIEVVFEADNGQTCLDYLKTLNELPDAGRYGNARNGWNGAYHSFTGAVPGYKSNNAFCAFK